MDFDGSTGLPPPSRYCCPNSRRSSRDSSLPTACCVSPMVTVISPCSASRNGPVAKIAALLPGPSSLRSIWPSGSTASPSSYSSSPPQKKEAIKITLYRWVEWVWRGYTSGTTLGALPHLFLFGIPISALMKVFEAKEKARRYLREMPLRLVYGIKFIRRNRSWKRGSSRRPWSRKWEGPQRANTMAATS